MADDAYDTLNRVMDQADERNLETLRMMHAQHDGGADDVKPPPIQPHHLGQQPPHEQKQVHHGREFYGAGNSPENVFGGEQGLGAVSPVGSPARGLDDSMNSFSSEVAAEEEQARMRVALVRKSFDGTDDLGDVMEEPEQRKPLFADSGRESGGAVDGSFMPPNLAELQAANLNRALTPAGPVPRPSEAQRLQMHSRGGARRAGPPALGGSSGSPEDYSWNTAFGPDPHARIEESERPWGAGRADSAARSPRQQQNSFRVEYEVERSPSSQQQMQMQQQMSPPPQQQQQQQQHMQQQQRPPPQQQQPPPQQHGMQAQQVAERQDRSSFLVPSHGSSFGGGAEDTFDESGRMGGSLQGRPVLGSSLQRQLERREREIHSLRMQCASMAKTLQSNGLNSSPVADNMSVASVQQDGAFTPSPMQQQQHLHQSPAAQSRAGSVRGSPVRQMPASGAEPSVAWGAADQGGPMAAAAAAAVGDDNAGGADPGWDDARPIDRVEAMERVGDAVQSLRRSVRWYGVDLRRDGGGDGSGADYSAGGIGAEPKRRELRGRAWHVLLIALFLVSGAGRLLLLLLLPDERAAVPATNSTGTLISTDDSRRWRSVLLLHAIVLGSCTWQCLGALGLVGQELRDWEAAICLDVQTHGDMRTVEGWMRKGRRHAGLGVLLGLGWGGLTTFAIWSSDGVEAQESAEAAFIWSWPFHESEAAQIVATLHTILVALLVAPLSLLPRLPLALAHAALLRGHRQRLARSFLLDAQGFGGNSRALIAGKAADAAARYRAMCSSVLGYAAALDGGNGASVALSLDLCVVCLAVYLLCVEPLHVGGVWLGVCGLLLARCAAQWPALMVLAASLSRYDELQMALLASAGSSAAPPGGGSQQAAVEELALQQLVAAQRPAVRLCGGCVVVGWPLLGCCTGLLVLLVVLGLLL